MANRIVMDVDGLRVSRPGVNVLTAAPDDLQFDSDYSSPSVFAKVELNITAGILHTYNYGKTFPSIPVVYWAINAGYPGNPAGALAQYIGTASHWIPSGSGTSFAFNLTVNAGSLSYRANGGSYLHNTPLRFIIWDHEAG